jgi:4,5-DOPA dioxygenase extradiol
MSSVPRRMPAVFFGHGSPMIALEHNRYTEAWRALGASIPKPRAILAVSAHWTTPGVAITADEAPKTIHDFYGFPQALFDIRYPAPGDPALAERVRALLAPVDVQLDRSWGLDHGTWSVLLHAYPNADVPVLQLSIDETRPNRFHYELGRRLAPLRDEGVLIAGLGNVVHNLRVMKRSESAPPYEWAVRFEARVRALLAARDHEPLIDYPRLGEDALLSVPTPEHYLPLLYVAGAQHEDEGVSFPVDGIELGSVGMLSAAVGLESGAPVQGRAH